MQKIISWLPQAPSQQQTGLQNKESSNNKTKNDDVVPIKAKKMHHPIQKN